MVSRAPKYTPHHESHAHHHHHDHNDVQNEQPSLGVPVFYKGEGYETLSFGVIFSNEVVFDAYKLQYYLEHLSSVLRVKGVFRTNHQWMAYNRIGDDPAGVFPSSYRKDSRLEILLSQESLLTYQKFEQGMKQLYEDCKMS